MFSQGERVRSLTMPFLKACDLGIVMYCLALMRLLATTGRTRISVHELLTMRARVSDVVAFVIAMSLWSIIFSAFGLYRSRRLSTRRAEIRDLVYASILVLLSCKALAVLFSLPSVTTGTLCRFGMLCIAALSAWRFLVRLGLAQIRTRGRNVRNVLIVGTNNRALEFARLISEHPEKGYRILGFVDHPWSGLDRFRESGYPLLGDFHQLPEYLRTNVVDEVVTFLPVASLYKHAWEIADLCKLHGIVMRFNSDIFRPINYRWHADQFEGTHYITGHLGPAQGSALVLKRTLDIVGSLLLLMLLGPILIAAALAIKLTSPGPVFFLQERVGLNKRRFRIYKFRTMVPNADAMVEQLKNQNEASGPVFKIRRDPRVTPIGRLLRRSSIDELPQLLNVLKGDMSLVGPRPLPLRDFEGFSVDWQRRRFSVKPGITCLWQVNGRSDIPFDESMLLDLRYMDEWSLWLDLKILVKTVPAVIRGAGAA